MNRIIIDNKSGLPDYDAVNAVQRVMSAGFQSTDTIQGEKNIPKYCDATTFTHKVKGKRITVWARPRKTTTSAYSFLVYDEEEKNEYE